MMHDDGLVGDDARRSTARKKQKLKVPESDEPNTKPPAVPVPHGVPEQAHSHTVTRYGAKNADSPKYAGLGPGLQVHVRACWASGDVVVPHHRAKA